MYRLQVRVTSNFRLLLFFFFFFLQSWISNTTLNSWSGSWYKLCGGNASMRRWWAFSICWLLKVMYLQFLCYSNVCWGPLAHKFIMLKKKQNFLLPSLLWVFIINRWWILSTAFSMSIMVAQSSFSPLGYSYGKLWIRFSDVESSWDKLYLNILFF